MVYWDFIFHMSSTEPSIKLKKITRNQGRLGSSDRTILPIAKILERSELFWAGEIVRSWDSYRDFDNHGCNKYTRLPLPHPLKF